jgi:hypothetical protein
MHTVDAARYQPRPFPDSQVSGWSAWPLPISALFKIVVRAISAALVVGIVPVAVLIVIFQERVRSDFRRHQEIRDYGNDTPIHRGIAEPALVRL